MAACAALAACSAGPPPRIRSVELIRRFGQAEKRPAAGVFALVPQTLAGTMRPGITVPVPGRLIFSTPVPRRATLRVFAGVLPSAGPATVRFRIGISDHRVYEGLVERTLATDGGGSGWSELEADLAPYAGWKWSIFYRPDRVDWRIVLSTDAVVGAPSRAAWGEPGIETDVPAARHFFHTRLVGRARTAPPA